MLWLALFLIQEIWGFNLRLETGCPEVFFGFPQFIQIHAEIEP